MSFSHYHICDGIILCIDFFVHIKFDFHSSPITLRLLLYLFLFLVTCALNFYLNIYASSFIHSLTHFPFIFLSPVIFKLFSLLHGNFYFCAVQNEINVNHSLSQLVSFFLFRFSSHTLSMFDEPISDSKIGKQKIIYNNMLLAYYI